MWFFGMIIVAVAAAIPVRLIVETSKLVVSTILEMKIPCWPEHRRGELAARNSKARGVRIGDRNYTNGVSWNGHLPEPMRDHKPHLEVSKRSDRPLEKDSVLERHQLHRYTR